MWSVGDVINPEAWVKRIYGFTGICGHCETNAQFLMKSIFSRGISFLLWIYIIKLEMLLIDCWFSKHVTSLLYEHGIAKIKVVTIERHT